MWWKILIIIFALIFLFLWQSIHVIIVYDGEFQLFAGLGLIRLNIIKILNSFKNKPKRDKPKKEKPKKEEKPKDEKPSKENVFSEVWKLRGVDGAVDLLGEFASLLSKFGSGLAKHFIVRKLTVRYAVTGKDAAQVAIKFGKMNAAIFTSLGVIASASQLKRHDILITPDYLGKEDKQYLKIHVSYRLLALIGVALAALKDFLSIMKRENKINARIKARSRAKAMAQAKREIKEINQSITE